MREKSTHNFLTLRTVRVLSHDLSPDLYAQLASSKRVAWDIETDGLDPLTSRIGTCQLYAQETGPCVVTDIAGKSPTFLPRLLSNKSVLKIFHHAPFDLSFMTQAWGVKSNNVACTKIAAKIVNPSAPSEEYSLKHLMLRHFGVKLDKEMRFTNWMADSLTDGQLQYAARDVIGLLELYDLLDERLKSQDSSDLYEKCCAFLPAHVELRLRGCPDPFSY